MPKAPWLGSDSAIRRKYIYVGYLFTSVNVSMYPVHPLRLQIWCSIRSRIVKSVHTMFDEDY